MRTWLFVCFVLGVCFAQEIFVVETGSSSPQSLFNIAGLTFRTLSPAEATRSGYAYSYQPSGLFADKPFQEGEVVLDIPAESTIGYVKILQDLPVLAEKRFSTVEEPFIVWLIHHRSLGAESSEWDFIKTLPDHLSTPLVYSSDFWSHFKDGTSQLIKSRAAADLNLLYQYYQSLLPMIDDYPDVFDAEFFTFDEYLKAYSVITHMIIVNPNGQPAIVPALRFNHSPTALPVQYTEDGTLQVVASRDIEIGDQIFISYGNKSNEDLVYQHGLTIENNPFDCIRIVLDINNPYWRTIAPFVFNTTTSTYKACVVPFLTWDSSIMVHFRTFVAQPDDINNLDKILNGERVSVRNELFALRGLYAAADTLRITPEDVERESENLIAKFWLRFLQHRKPNLEQLLTRVLGFWDYFLVLEDVPELDN